jgi:PTS system nitrogen regulatory IIA component
VKITDFLTAESVIPELAGSNKQTVLNELAERFSAAHGLPDGDRVLEVLKEREKISTTAIGEGVAIPHGKLRAVEKVRAVFARSTAGVNFDSLDGAPTYLFFALLAPEDGAADHLKAMARISRLLKDADFRERLLKGESRQELFDIIAAEDEKF